MTRETGQDNCQKGETRMEKERKGETKTKEGQKDNKETEQKKENEERARMSKEKQEKRRRERGEEIRRKERDNMKERQQQRQARHKTEQAKKRRRRREEYRRTMERRQRKEQSAANHRGRHRPQHACAVQDTKEQKTDEKRETKKKKTKKKLTVIELEQEAEQLLRERIKEMAVPTGSLSKLMTALMGTAKIATTNKRIESWMNTQTDKEQTLLECLSSLEGEGMLNKEGRALAIVAQNPSVHAWRHLIDVLVQPRGEGVGRRRREARQLVRYEWNTSMPKLRDALQHAMGTAEGLVFQKRMTEI